MEMPGIPEGYIAGISFGYDLKRADYFTDAPLRSLELLKKQTGANTVIFAFHALQDDPQSTQIDYLGGDTPTEEGLARLVHKARELRMHVILKPMLDCRNGTWRGHINFFDKDVPCEPKWSDWFASYTSFQVHFAKIAERLRADMLCIACEMVQTQRRDREWRACIAEIRKHYHGPLTWNADKYQEDEVTFWDALDVISSSGYYPIDDWERQLARIETVAKRFQKPFFFIECGCMTCKSSPAVPNSWIRFRSEVDALAKARGLELALDRTVDGLYRGLDFSALPEEIRAAYREAVDFKAQADFYRAVFDACDRHDFVQGFGLWDWNGKLNITPETVCYDGGYGLYLKPSADVVKAYFSRKLG